jgi:ferredoxin
MKVSVDVELCQGHGQCEESAPDVFEVRDDGLAYVIGETDTSDKQARTREAASRCPVDAIRITE